MSSAKSLIFAACAGLALAGCAAEEPLWVRQGIPANYAGADYISCRQVAEAEAAGRYDGYIDSLHDRRYAGADALPADQLRGEEDRVTRDRETFRQDFIRGCMEHSGYALAPSSRIGG